MRRYLVPFQRHFDTLLTSVFVFMTLDGIASVFFLHVNNVRNACKRQRYSQNFWRDFFIRWRESWKNLKATITFSSFSNKS